VRARVPYLEWQMRVYGPLTSQQLLRNKGERRLRVRLGNLTRSRSSQSSGTGLLTRDHIPSGLRV